MENAQNIILRKARQEDIDFLRNLRNEPDVYRYSRQAREASREEHAAWFSKINEAGGETELFIIQDGQIPVGQVRVDLCGAGEAEISISVSQEFRGNGFAARAVELLIARVVAAGDANRLVATVHEDNAASARLFEKLGFKFEIKEGEWRKYGLNLPL